MRGMLSWISINEAHIELAIVCLIVEMTLKL